MSGTRRLSAKDRIAALKRLAALDTRPDEALDRLADLARGMLGVPVVLVSLVDDHRQFFKSAVGLSEPWRSRRGTPLSHSFCKHAVEQGEPLVIPNARDNPLVKDNPAERRVAGPGRHRCQSAGRPGDRWNRVQLAGHH